MNARYSSSSTVMMPISTVGTVAIYNPLKLLTSNIDGYDRHLPRRASLSTARVCHRGFMTATYRNERGRTSISSSLRIWNIGEKVAAISSAVKQ